MNLNMGEGIKFERIRRITGYLVGTMDKWNNAKKAEEHDRVKHGVSTGIPAGKKLEGEKTAFGYFVDSMTNRGTKGDEG